MAENAVHVTKTDEQTAPETREEARTLTPPVDIFELEEGLVVVADLPGVAKEDIEVRLENDILTIRGKAKPSLSGAMLYSEYELVNYHRQFQLNEEVERENVQAEMKYGVLTVRLPKAERTKPKRIEVNVS